MSVRVINDKLVEGVPIGIGSPAVPGCLVACFYTQKLLFLRVRRSNRGEGPTHWLSSTGQAGDTLKQGATNMASASATAQLLITELCGEDSSL